jgi:hypothetical protein
MKKKVRASRAVKTGERIRILEREIKRITTHLQKLNPQP